MMLNPPRQCSIPGCEKGAWAKDMCTRHYDANRRHGSPYAEIQPAPPKRTPEERFWFYVTKGPDCWGWTGHTSCGYGVLTGDLVNGKHHQVKAHRFSYELHNGPIPDGLHVLHKCDNPPCSNPSHLFLGTQADNTRDMYAKGREGRNTGHPGTSHAMAKLTEDAVRSIRASTGPARIQAKKFKVSESTIYMIRGGHIWKHIE